MIDTIVMKIPFNKAIILNYSRFTSEEAVSRLVRSSVFGSPNTISNNPTTQETYKWYFPRITLIKSKYPSNCGFVHFKIEFSVPKILFENNIYECSEEYFYLFLAVLQDKLWRMGLCIEIVDLANAYISRIDFGKNILLLNNCYSFIRYVNKIPLDSRLDRTETNYSNKGYGCKQHSDDYQISCYDKGFEYKNAVYSGDEKHLKNNKYHEALECIIRHKRKNILRLEVSFFKKRKLKELCESLNIDIGECKLHNLFKDNISKTILQHYVRKITTSMRKLNLDAIDETAMLDRIEKTCPEETRNKTLILFAQNILYSKYGTDFLRHRFNYKSDELCKVKRELQKINSSENSSFSSIMQNIHAVENCLEEFLPLGESDFFER